MSYIMDIISRANRNVKDLTREELEELILEMIDEEDSRKLKIHKLKIFNDQLLTRVEVVHESARKNTMTYITPPESKIENKFKKKAKEMNREFYIEPMTSYNPYQASNKHIVTMRHKVTDMLNKINKTNEERYKLECKKENLKNKLESREFGKENPFKPFNVTSKRKETTKNVTFNGCAKLCEKFLSEENDMDTFQRLECVFNLLTANDKKSLRQFSDICMPNYSDRNLKELDDILNDRNAQASILYQQYSDFLKKHEKMVQDFIQLQLSMKNQSDENDYIKNNLLEQIEDLKYRINEIPKVQDQIKELTSKREELYNEMDKIRTKRLDSVENEVKLKADIVDLNEEKLGFKLQVDHLENSNTEFIKLKEERTDQISTINKDIEDLKTKLNELRDKLTENRVIVNLLDRAKITTSFEVNDIYEMSRKFSVQDISDNYNNISNDYRKTKQLLQETKIECQSLIDQDDTLQSQILHLKTRIDSAKRASMEAIKNEIPDF